MENLCCGQGYRGEIFQPKKLTSLYDLHGSTISQGYCLACRLGVVPWTDIDSQEDIAVKEWEGCPECNLENNDAELLIKKAILGVRRVEVLSATSKRYDQSIVLLDTCADETIFYNRRLFKKIESYDPLVVEGVGGGEASSVFTSDGGDTIFGEAYHSNDVIANILSYGRAKDQLYQVNYDNALDQFMVQPTENSIIYRFKRVLGK